MDLSTYSGLQAAVLSWMNRDDLTDEVAGFVTLAESEINRELRTSFQLTRWTGALAAEFVDLPPHFRMMRTLRLTSGTGSLLREITPEQMAARKAFPGQFTAEPIEFTAINGQMELWPVPDRSYAAAMEYQAGMTALSGDNLTNWLLTDHPDVYLYGALSQACGFVMNDQRAVMFDTAFRRALGEVQEALRTSYDRTLRVDAGLMQRPRDRPFNIFTGE